MNTGTPIWNAGLVLTSNYLKMLFERLGFLENDAIKPSDQDKAVHYLNCLAYGPTSNYPDSLSLSKVLCGLKLEAPIPSSIDLTEEDRQLMDGLLVAMIGHWSAIYNITPEGFRGNWLVRDGRLTEEAKRWTLVVEKKQYDLLLYQCPFSFSLVHFPWMEKPLHFTWI
ncbi:contractile injection system tape measure protein [Paraglaciecola sp.]|uniref:contractile injection system tape measure protein n=1 Tax=Paraglaciecola sp. TaxID=1920173 RepID=UPI003265E2C3